MYKIKNNLSPPYIADLLNRLTVVVTILGTLILSYVILIQSLMVNSLRYLGPVMRTKLDSYIKLWPFTWKRAIMAFRFRTEYRLEPVWKPFERNLHSFERPGSSVQKNLHPFERLDHPFDRNVQPFEWLAHPFGKSIHPFERLAHPFDKNVQPFERLTHPFVKNNPTVWTTCSPVP